MLKWPRCGGASKRGCAPVRSPSLVVGALIGLILGAIVAIAGEDRFRKH